jgi:hypothetical protein
MFRAPKDVTRMHAALLLLPPMSTKRTSTRQPETHFEQVSVAVAKENALRAAARKPPPARRDDATGTRRTAVPRTGGGRRS